ncbi:MAG TPA: glycosyltransferase family 2 protein [Syntrophomonadaceae bacterium]|nr:glycosyltransferase family 2 protein [Syntrophomonadaceae bacterium]
MEKISIVVPCYNEQEALQYFYDEVVKLALEMPTIIYEFVLVDDGSQDNTLKLIKELQSKDGRIKYLSFSRNFGKESAIYAGLKNSSGDYVAIMDADLQDPPILIKDMYHIIINDGYDCVATRRKTRHGEPPVRSFFARQFYRIINRISNIELVDGARDFRLMTRQMVDSILQISEINRFSKGIFAWVGFKTKWLEYENRERIAGQTKWSFWKLYLYSLDGIMSFSTTPLAIASIIGVAFFLTSFLMLTIIMVRQLTWGGSAFGWPMLVCIMLFITGIQLFCTGIVGQYLSRTYLETKRRPLYIVKEFSDEMG